jgi:uncharacterized protein (DUF433 family)
MLGIPAATVANWLKPALLGGERGGIVVPDDPEGRLLSFRNLTELFVLGSLRRIHRLGLPRIRTAVRCLRDQLNVERPLLHRDLYTDNYSLFVEHMGQLLEVSRGRQGAMREIVAPYLTRIEWDDGEVAALYPFTVETPTSDARREVVIAGRVAFGRPHLAASGIPTAVIASRWRAGELPSEIAFDLELNEVGIDEAIRYENRRHRQDAA